MLKNLHRKMPGAVLVLRLYKPSANFLERRSARQIGVPNPQGLLDEFREPVEVRVSLIRVAQVGEEGAHQQISFAPNRYACREAGNGPFGIPDFISYFAVLQAVEISCESFFDRSGEGLVERLSVRLVIEINLDRSGRRRLRGRCLPTRATGRR